MRIYNQYEIHKGPQMLFCVAKVTETMLSAK